MATRTNPTPPPDRALGTNLIAQANVQKGGGASNPKTDKPSSGAAPTSPNPETQPNQKYACSLFGSKENDWENLRRVDVRRPKQHLAELRAFLGKFPNVKAIELNKGAADIAIRNFKNGVLIYTKGSPPPQLIYDNMTKIEMYLRGLEKMSKVLMCTEEEAEGDDGDSLRCKIAKEWHDPNFDSKGYKLHVQGIVTQRGFEVLVLNKEDELLKAAAKCKVPDEKTTQIGVP